MELEFYDNTIRFEKILNFLDKFVLDFTKLLDKHNIKYVLISGYVAILFGRSRSSEYIDIFIEKIEYEKFLNLWHELYKNFECLATDKPKDAYEEYLKNKTAIRFSYKHNYIPNMEMKFPDKNMDEYALSNRMKVVLNERVLFISKLELQIAYKLFLGSEKDIEDAKYLYNIFKENLKITELNEFIRRLGVVSLFVRYIK